MILRAYHSFVFNFTDLVYENTIALGSFVNLLLKIFF